MKRLLYDELLNWKNSAKHIPILMRGARQVGKTFLVEMLGNNEFNSFTNINFEFSPQFCQCFDNLDPLSIVNSISAITRKPITPGKSLLFLDEIQHCPQAIIALRYFKEKMPNLHVIAAGSLLEFSINDDEFQMPVGRIRSLFVKPVSFWEYLLSNDYEQIIDTLQNSTLQSKLSTPIHQHLNQLLREYFVLGGMPEVIADYQNDSNLLNVQATQSSILNTYRNDFGKYAAKTKHKYLQRIFEQAPGLISQHFKYSKVDPHFKSRDLKEAIELLENAGVIHRIYETQASGLPLNSLINTKRFKLLFVDIGLVKASSLLDPNLMLKEDLMLINRGALVEQFVGQELLAYGSPYLPGQLFYWDREKKGSEAEVDYIVNFDDNIIPIEVKSGKTGSLRSIHVFLNEKQSKFGIRISLKPLGFNNNILSVPLYMIHELSRIVQEII